MICMNVLRMFFVFEDLLWKLLGVLEAWIRRASLICSFLAFMEVFELDFNELLDLEG